MKIALFCFYFDGRLLSFIFLQKRLLSYCLDYKFFFFKVQSMSAKVELPMQDHQAFHQRQVAV